jgi:Arc/MetJ-type ribon-helix-helix transcriptional regulator
VFPLPRLRSGVRALRRITQQAAAKEEKEEEAEDGNNVGGGDEEDEEETQDGLSFVLLCETLTHRDLS